MIPKDPTATSASEPRDNPATVRTALLDAAEQLFSENGIEGTSVREISKAAGVNLGAINYYFGTKEVLAVEVFARRIEPVNRERIARLDALEAAAGPQPADLEQIVDALIRPAIESENAMVGFGNCMRLISRAFQEPNAEVKKFVEKQFEEVARRFNAAILRAAPGVPPGELFWRMKFAFGALHHGQEMWIRFDHLPQPTEIVPVKLDRDGFIQRIISFITAGLAAPMSSASSAKP